MQVEELAWHPLRVQILHLGLTLHQKTMDFAISGLIAAAQAAWQAHEDVKHNMNQSKILADRIQVLSGEFDDYSSYCVP